MIGQLWIALLLVLAVVGSGAPLARWAGRGLQLPTSTRVSLVPIAGLTFVGAATLLLGHAHLLGWWVPYVLAVAGVAMAFVGLSANFAPVRDGWKGVARHVRGYPVPLIATSVALLLALVSTMAAPFRVDEVEYHWAAPVAWAEAGGWNDSPYRHVDGHAFMEIIYTAAATGGSYVAAHLLHFISFLALGFALAGLAGALGVKGVGVTAAAGLAMPVVWDSSYVAYNDIPVAAMTIAGAAVIMGAQRGRMHAAWIAGALVGVAVSMKPTAIAGVGLIGLMLILRYAFERAAASAAAAPTHRPRLVPVLWQAAAVIAPGAAALAFWPLRRLLMTGQMFDAVSAPSEYELTMLPSAIEQALAPLLPFAGSIIGGSEPWGGRIGFVLVLLVPAIAYAIWRRGDVLRRFVLAIVPAWAHWIVLGLQIVRTRFHIASWALMTIAVRIPLEDAQDRWPKARRWLEAAWTLAILVGLTDVSIEMVKRIASLLPIT